MVFYRRKAREMTLQILFQKEFTDTKWNVSLDYFVKKLKIHKKTSEYAQVLLTQILKNQDILNEIITKASYSWKLHRMSLIDLNILRMSISELIYFKEEIAPQIVINEAIEIAKKYGTKKSHVFINGILDRIYKQDSLCI